jgi:hypothetical protein
MSHLGRCFGHFLNWYETGTLLPELPLFISSVDSGNLAASLIALKGGCADRLEMPLLAPSLVEGYEDHLRLLVGSEVLPPRKSESLRERERHLPWMERLCALISDSVGEGTSFPSMHLALRREQVRRVFSGYMPWLLPEFESLRRQIGIELNPEKLPPVSELPAFIEVLVAKLLQGAAELSEAEQKQRDHLLALLAIARARSISLIKDLRMIATKVERWVKDMNFGPLLERRRKLLSVGFDLGSNRLDPACYDLLASEARIAAFIAIGKGDVPQDTWFRMGRAFVPASSGASTLISWAGTMFEYLMPAIWMRSQQNTLLWRSMQGAVRAHMAYAATRDIPWGVSEAGYDQLDDAGMYSYAAMGVPELALRDRGPDRLVVAPYASAMALAVLPNDAIRNLRRMADLGWLGEYGFYEAADFGSGDQSGNQRPSLVRAWMAHHQGMILLSIGNLLCDNVTQRWFHGDARVRATELLLDERAVVQHARRSWRALPVAKPTRIPHTGNKRQDGQLDIAS